MSARPAVFASLALGAPALSSPHSAPQTTKYLLDLKVETVLDLTVFGQPAQQTSIDLKGGVTLTLSDSAGGKVVHVIVDSLNVVTTTPEITAATADSAKGSMVHGFLDPTGRVRNLSSKPANTLVTMVQAIINGIFPRIKRGAKAGDRWVDTTDINNTGEGNNTTVHVIIDYTAGGMETAAGMPALKVSATSQSVVSGTMERPTVGTIEVEGGGTGGGTFFIGTDGRFLGGNLSSTTDQKLKVTGAPVPIPLKVTQRLTVTALP